MTDYYPLISRAVAGLQKNTGESRRALYERARGALLQQLRGQTPALTEEEITRERLALEDAIRKVEAEAARRAREAEVPAAPAAANDAAAAKPARDPAPEAKKAAAIPGLRDVVADTEGLGDKTARASRSAREAYAAASGPARREDERIEPRVEPDTLRGSPDPAVGSGPVDLDAGGPRPRARLDQSELDGKESRGSRRGLIVGVAVLLLLLAVGAGAYWQRDRIVALFSGAGTSAVTQPQQPRTPNQGSGKITDRIGQDGEAGAGGTGAQSGQVAPVAQRVILYEEDPADPNGKRLVGTAVWRTETVQNTATNTPELAIRGDVQVPERQMSMTMTIRRNTDAALPASHTIEVMFNLPADFPFGGVANVAAILMKQAEQSRGAPLAGLTVKVTTGFFLMGLSSSEVDQQRNVQLLKERTWFDVPLVYNNGRRAILAVEKGTPGERVFAEAFAAWKQ